MNLGEAQGFKIIQTLLERPRESLSVELKSWIDPRVPEGAAKLVKAALAIRNHPSGGYIVLGVNKNGTLELPQEGFFPREVFAWDNIQQIISRHASHLFEVAVHFVVRNDVEHPVIQIPGGPKTPVACRADFRGSDGTLLLRENDIYVRTLAANGSVSSAKVSWKDLDFLVEGCFRAREVDHVAFFKKLFSGLDKRGAKTIFENMREVASEAAAGADALLSRGAQIFMEEANERSAAIEGIGFLEIALRISGNSKEWKANREFLTAIDAANPDLTGWPIWLVSDRFSDRESRPFQKGNTWRQFIYAPNETSFNDWGHLDFMLFDPRGEFFHRRALQDDLSGPKRQLERGRWLEPIIQILRVAEALAVGAAFARAMDYEPDSSLEFGFRWSGLQGRLLSTWSNPAICLYTGSEVCREKSVTSYVRLTTNPSENDIAEMTEAAMNELTRYFGGYELPQTFVETQVKRVLNRRL